MNRNTTTGQFEPIPTSAYANWIGQRQHHLVVVDVIYGSQKCACFLCKCDCGKMTEVSFYDFTHEHKKSCGCLKSRLGNLYSHPLYKTWNNITQRAGKHKNYRHITVCEEWKNDFLTFYNWSMSHGWKKGLTIDRIDYNGNYEPDNCRWITQKEQCRNKRTNNNITLFGKTQCITDWGKEYHLNLVNIYRRVKNKHTTYEHEIQRAINKKQTTED